jgi:hypothetical protein
MHPKDTPDVTGSAGDEVSGLRVCTACTYYRVRPHIKLFDSADLQSTGALSAQVKWDEEQRQRASEEQLLYAARRPFESEPQHYAWCASYTKVEAVEKARAGDEDAQQALMHDGGASFNPVTGEITPLYVLCAYMNPDGRCESYEPKA